VYICPKPEAGQLATHIVSDLKELQELL
jgi:hypothetical protein